MEQLSFDFERLNNRIKVGDAVKITAVPDETRQEIETYYYLQEHSGKVGIVENIVFSKRVVFEVLFKNGEKGFFYEHEIKKIDKGDVKCVSGNKSTRKIKRKN